MKSGDCSPGLPSLSSRKSTFTSIGPGRGFPGRSWPDGDCPLTAAASRGHSRPGGDCPLTAAASPGAQSARRGLSPFGQAAASRRGSPSSCAVRRGLSPFGPGRRPPGGDCPQQLRGTVKRPCHGCPLHLLQRLTRIALRARMGEERVNMRRAILKTSALAARVFKGAALQKKDRGLLSTGIETLDSLLNGGFPRGQLTELTGPVSSGKTALLFSAIARATQRGEAIAYVDAFNSFDPVSAAKAGIDLKRLLWVRCQSSLERALQAGDIVSRAGGFGVIALDLETAGPAGQAARSVRKISYHCWLRLQQAIEGTTTALLLLTPEAAAGSSSTLVVTLSRQQVYWQTSSGMVKHPVPGCRLFHSLGTELRIVRGKINGHGAFCCRFQ
jgi:hypothetical protein